jgi:NAD(P)-dependent dehydrogenase (short-subunit alcohol dehydrogenase family)
VAGDGGELGIRPGDRGGGGGRRRHGGGDGAADRVARRLVAAHPDHVDPVALDVTTAAASGVVDDVVAKYGRLDVLVNNAGRTQVGALEETTDEELRHLFELHFFGPALITRAALPHLRRHGGTVVQMSSVGGQVTAPGFGAYCATKFALEGLTETLSQEVPGDVRFVIVEPGAFRTGLFEAGAAVVSTPMPEYEATVGPTREYVTTGGGSQPGDPAKAAAAVLRAVDAERPPLRLALGADAVDAIRGRLDSLGSELSAWEAVSRDTALD